VKRKEEESEELKRKYYRKSGISLFHSLWWKISPFPST
jgi:hypothetical protein